MVWKVCIRVPGGCLQGVVRLHEGSGKTLQGVEALWRVWDIV